MTPGEFHSSIRAVVQLLQDLELLASVNQLGSHVPSDEFRQAAMSGVPYCDLFCIGIEKRDFSVQLMDQSFFQFAMIGDRDFELRYAFYPNPFEALTFEAFKGQNPEAAEEDGGFEQYSQYLSEQDSEISAPPIRYDHAPRQYQELVHPVGHFHFGTHGGNRWPIGLVLSPLTFALHIAKMFYADAWKKGVDTENGRNQFDDRFARAKEQCAALEAEHFSAAERALIHIA